MTVIDRPTDRGPARSFWIFFSAGAVSRTGSAVTVIALPLVAAVLLGASTTQMGLLAAAGNIAWLVLGLPSGAIISRLPLRRVQVGADLVRCVGLLSIPIAWWAGVLGFGQLLVVALVCSLAEVLFEVANSTFVTSVVAEEDLQARNSLLSGTDAATQLGGPALGGLVVAAVGAATALIVDAVSYLISAALLRSLSEPAAEKPDQWPPLRSMIAQGWQFVIGHPVISRCLWAAALVNFACGAQIALYSVHLVRDLHTPGPLIGLLFAGEGVGALIGAALVGRAARMFGDARSCLLALGLSGFGAILVPLGGGVGGQLLFVVGNALFACGAVIFSVSTRTYRQLHTPPELLARVMATVRFVSWGAIPVGGLVAGVLAGSVGIRATLLVFAVAVIAAPLLLVFSPFRRERYFTAPAGAECGQSTTGSSSTEAPSSTS